MSITSTNPDWTQWNLSYFRPDIYGPLYGGHSIQQAAYNTLEKWFPAYLYEVNRQMGADWLEVPLKWDVRPDMDTASPTTRPRVMVLVPGTVGEPEQTNSAIRSTWEVEVSTWVFGTTDWGMTQALTQAYAPVQNAIMIQHGKLGGLAESTMWTGTQYKEKEFVSMRTAAIVISTFEVTLSSTFTKFGGPPLLQFSADGANVLPSVLPPAPAPEVTEVTTVVENEL